MKKEWADKWVAALRSGKYTQGQRRLCAFTEDGLTHCCLGVLCDIAGAEQDTLLRYDGEMSFLPQFVMDKTGVKTHNGAALYRKSLIQLNDQYNHDFNEIANVIERHWETL